jgi:hypothetical protein
VLCSYLLGFGDPWQDHEFSTTLPTVRLLSAWISRHEGAWTVCADGDVGCKCAGGTRFLKVSAFLTGRWGLKQQWTHRLQGLLALFWIGLFALEQALSHASRAFNRAGCSGCIDGWRQSHWMVYRRASLGESFWEALNYMYFSTYHWLPLVERHQSLLSTNV